MLFETQTPAELKPIAAYILSDNSRRVVVLKGNLGAGKTTLVKEICAQLEVKENVSSPTFGLVNEYSYGDNQTAYHFDFYRIKNVAEAYDIGFEEYLDSGNWCFIEWPENIEPMLGGLAVQEIIININSAGKRIFEILKR